MSSYITMATVQLILCLEVLWFLVNGEVLHQFEYEYRVLDELIELKNRQTFLLDRIGQMDERIIQLTNNYNGMLIIDQNITSIFFANICSIN